MIEMDNFVYLARGGGGDPPLILQGDLCEHRLLLKQIIHISSKYITKYYDLEFQVSFVK